MGLWKRTPPVEPEPEQTGMVADRVVENTEWDSDAWLGPVAFGADGWFHPVRMDDNGEIGPDLSIKLIHNTETGRHHRAQDHHRDHKAHWEEIHGGRDQVLEVEG